MVPTSAGNFPTRALGALALIVCFSSCGEASKAETPDTVAQARGLQSESEVAAPAPRVPAAKARSTKAKPVSKPTKSKGAMSQIPVKLGYYVGLHGTCEKPLYMMKLESDGYWELLPEDPAESFRMEFGKVTRSTEKGRASYFIAFAGKNADICEEGEACNSGAELVLLGGNRIGFGVQDTATLSYCAPERVPKSLRR